MSSLSAHRIEDSDESDIKIVSYGQPNGKTKQTPLPWAQLSMLYLIEIAECAAITVVHPFINKLVQETGITRGDERRTGYFTGIIQSADSLSEAFSLVLLGVASDRLGRKPVLLFGLLGVVPVMLLFGMSTRFWTLVLSRFMLGICNGNMGIIKTVIGEITDSTNIAEAFAYLPVASTAGVTIGTFIGGLLSHPAEKWPDIFGKSAYLHHYPYFLPCLVISAFSMLAFVFGAVALKETLSQVEKATASLRNTINEPHYGSTGTSSRGHSLQECILPGTSIGYERRVPPSVLRLLKLRDMRIILTNFALLAFCSVGLYMLCPLMWSTSIELGGLGWSSYSIGMTMSVNSVVTALMQLAVFAKLLRRFGPRRLYTACLSGFFVSSLCFPLANLFARRASGNDWKVWITVIASLAGQLTRFGSYAALQIIITRSANRSSLGTINGLAHGVAAVGRCLGPFIVLSMHSISLQYQLAGGNAVYFIMAAIVAYAIRVSLLLPKQLRL